jgi:hypothetical protein
MGPPVWHSQRTIKRRLRIKGFSGYQRNAAKRLNLVWHATYVLIAMVDKKLPLNVSLESYRQVLPASIFEKVEISFALKTTQQSTDQLDFTNQLNPFVI